MKKGATKWQLWADPTVTLDHFGRQVHNHFIAAIIKILGLEEGPISLLRDLKRV